MHLSVHRSILREARRRNPTRRFRFSSISLARMSEPESSSAATDLLIQASAGDSSALAQVFPLIYEELRHLAHRQLLREAEGRTLSTTALVHEAYLRLIDQTRVQWSGRAHFMAIAATAMRRILIDRARQHRSQKRGGQYRRVPLESVDLGAEDRADVLLALDAALDRLRQLNERQARIVECRFFGGMTEEETAEALGIGLRTTTRDWAKARSWLYEEIYREHLG